MNVSPVLALVAGAAAAVGAVLGFAASTGIALVIGVLYASAGYLYVSSDASLLDSATRFEDRASRLAYAVGLFGLAMSPLAIGRHYTDSDVSFVFILWFAGAIAFLELSSNAPSRDGS